MHVPSDPPSSCCFTSTEARRTVRDGEPRTVTSTFTQLLSSEGLSSHRQTQRQIDRQTGRQAGRQAVRHAGRQAGRQAGRHARTHTHTAKETPLR